MLFITHPKRDQYASWAAMPPTKVHAVLMYHAMMLGGPTTQAVEVVALFCSSISVRMFQIPSFAS
jgi:hypothetical protein